MGEDVEDNFLIPRNGIATKFEGTVREAIGLCRKKDSLKTLKTKRRVNEMNGSSLN